MISDICTEKYDADPTKFDLPAYHAKISTTCSALVHTFEYQFINLSPVIDWCLVSIWGIEDIIRIVVSSVIPESLRALQMNFYSIEHSNKPAHSTQGTRLTDMSLQTVELMQHHYDNLLSKL